MGIMQNNRARYPGKWLKAVLILLLQVICISSFSEEAEEYGKLLQYRKVPGSTGCAAALPDGEYLYTIGYAGLTVYRISEPQNPHRIAELRAVRNGRQMVKHGNYLYITARNFGLWIVDVTHPATPRIARRYDTVELATGVAAAGNLLFVAQRGYGVQILQITNPTDPQHLAQLLTDEAQSVACRGNLLYIGDWGSGRLTIADISNPRAPKRLSRTALDGCGDGVALKGSLCYVSTGHHSRRGSPEERFGRGHGVEVFDISNPIRPRKIGGIKFPKSYDLGADFWNVRISGNHLLASDSRNGLFLLDISAPDAPKCLGRVLLAGEGRKKRSDGSVQLINDSVSWAAPGNGVIYVTGSQSGLYTVEFPGIHPQERQPHPDFRIPEKKPLEYPGFVQHDFGGMVRRVAPAARDMAYIACSGKGIRLVHISGNRIREIANYPVGCAYDVAVRNGFLYSLENIGTLAIYRIGRKGELTSVGKCSLPNEILFSFMLSADGHFAVCRGYGKLHFFDISNPAAPKQVYTHASGAILYSDPLPERDYKGIFPVNCHFAGIYWYDLSGTKPRFLGKISGKKSGQMNGLTLVGNRFLLPTNRGNLFILNPLDRSPESAREGISVPGSHIAGIPSFDGKGTLVFSERRNGVIHTLEASDLQNLRLNPARSFRLPGSIPDRVVFLDGRMMIPAGHAGLLLEKLP